MGEPVRGSRVSLQSLANCRFQFHRPAQLVIGVHDETLSLAVSVNNPDGSPHWNQRLESTAETQPKLQPALLSLFATISPGLHAPKYDSKVLLNASRLHYVCAEQRPVID
jgi:hypothetical protein